MLNFKSEHWLISGKIPEPIYLIDNTFIDDLNNLNINDIHINLEKYPESMKRLGYIKNENLVKYLKKEINGSDQIWDDWISIALNSGNNTLLKHCEMSQIIKNLKHIQWLHPQSIDWIQLRDKNIDLNKFTNLKTLATAWINILELNVYKYKNQEQLKELSKQWWSHSINLDLLSRFSDLKLSLSKYSGFKKFLEQHLNESESTLLAAYFPMDYINDDDIIKNTISQHRLKTLGVKIKAKNKPNNSLFSLLEKEFPLSPIHYKKIIESLDLDMKRKLKSDTRYIWDALSNNDLNQLEYLSISDWKYIEDHATIFHYHPDVSHWISKKSWISKKIKDVVNASYTKDLQINWLIKHKDSCESSFIQNYVINFLNYNEADIALKAIDLWYQNNLMINVENTNELNNLFPTIKTETWDVICTKEPIYKEQAMEVAHYLNLTTEQINTPLLAILTCYEINDLKSLLKALDEIELNSNTYIPVL